MRTGTTKLDQDIRHVQEVCQQVKDSLKKAIQSLPDNPRIKRIENSPSCFIIRSSDLFYKKPAPTEENPDRTMTQSNWSPEFHDFKTQYELLCEIIDRTEVFNVLPKLRKIIEEGSWRVTYSKTKRDKNQMGRSISRRFQSGYTFIFHPDVIEHLKGIVG